MTLASVPDSEIKAWHRLGFTHIWAMGVWTTGPRSRSHTLENAEQQSKFSKLLPDLKNEDVPGSPYAISDYKVPAALGGEEGLKRFREQLNAKGIKLLLDFVPNHVALDHPWVASRPEMMVQSPIEVAGTFAQQTVAGPRWIAHGKDPHFPPWTDTVQIDYRRAVARAAMVNPLRMTLP